jgi:hypothetical protein
VRDPLLRQAQYRLFPQENRKRIEGKGKRDKRGGPRIIHRVTLNSFQGLLQMLKQVQHDVLVSNSGKSVTPTSVRVREAQACIENV